MKKAKKLTDAQKKIIVKYNNELNLLTFPKLSLTQNRMVQLVLAFTIDEHDKYNNQNFLTRFFNKETRTIEIEFAKFYKLINGDEWKISAIEVGKSIDDMLDKLVHSVLRYEDEAINLRYSCFEKAAYMKHEQLIKITIQKDFYNMITAYQKGFTIIDYFEYCSLNSIYSQNLYPILRQFRTTGEVNIFSDKWEQFYSIMQFPENAEMRDINKILNQVVKELTEARNLFDKKRIPFENLQYKKIKGAGRGRGGKVVGIVFNFKPQRKELEPAENPQEPSAIPAPQEPQEYIFTSDDLCELKVHKDRAYLNDKLESIKITSIDKTKLKTGNEFIVLTWENQDTGDKFKSPELTSMAHFKNYIKGFTLI